jgi:hypothetical protein
MQCPCAILSPVAWPSLPCFLTHYLINGKIFRGNIIEHKMCFGSLHKSVWNISYGARPALFLIFMLFYVLSALCRSMYCLFLCRSMYCLFLCRSMYCLFCVVLCIVCFVSFYVFFVLCRSTYCLFCVVVCIVCFVSFCVLFVLCRSVYCLFCVVLCIVCFVSFCVLFVLCCSMYCLFCVVLCIVCVYMCIVLLPPGGYPIAVNKYINIKENSEGYYHKYT